MAASDKAFKDFEAKTRLELGQLQAQLHEHKEDAEEQQRILQNKVNILLRENSILEHKIEELELDKCTQERFR